MSKVRIAGKRGLLDDVLGALGDAGVVHLVDANRVLGEQSDGLTALEGDDRSLSRRRHLRADLQRIQEAAALLRVDLEGSLGSAPTPRPVDTLDGLDEDLCRARAWAAEREELRDELAVAERYRTLCQAFRPALEKVDGLKRVSFLGVTLDARHRDEVLPLLRDHLAEITGGGYQLMWRPLDEGTIGLLLLFPPSASDAVGALLSGENIHEIRLPHRYQQLPLGEGLTAVERLLRELPIRIGEKDVELETLRDRYAATLPVRARELHRQIAETELTRLFAATRYLFLVVGYVPTSRLGGLRETLAGRFGDQVEVSTLPIRAGERREVPVEFENPPWNRPFQRLLSLLPLPRYGTLDPTPLMALAFPLFFGIILGDVGYGVLVLALAWFVRRRWGEFPLGRDLGALLIASAVATILFGFVFGELFGDLGHRLGLRPLWEDRLAAAMALLVLTVSLGVFHVLLSLLLGAIQEAREQHIRKSAAGVMNVVAIVALLCVLASLARLLPAGTLRVALGALIGVVAVLIYLDGLVALVELVAAIGNILSYVRLMALGIASAALALVANQLAGATGTVVAGAVVALLLHGVNLVLGLFSPSIHSLRLHYVEFLPRFYKFGGTAYRPYQKGEGT